MLRTCNFCRVKSKRLWFVLGCFAILQLLFVGFGLIRYRTSGFVRTLIAHQPPSRIVGQHLYLRNQSTAVKSKEPFIDMVNDYYPFVDFKFEYPFIMPAIKGHRYIFLVVLVNSAAKGDEYRKRRTQIRQTWGNMTTCEQSLAIKNPTLRDLKWRLVFVLGKAGPGTHDDELNAIEAEQHNDILIGNINDNYLNNIIKFYMAQLWASSMFNANYTMKTDDDVYVRIPGVVEYLYYQGYPSRFYGGAIQRSLGLIVSRTPGDKWSISRKYFSEDIWPPFHFGAFIILSTDLLPSLFNYVHIRKPFHVDDAYVGVAMRYLKVNATDIISFVVKRQMPALLKKKNNCQIQAIVAFGHSIDPGLSNTLHEKIESMCRNNISIISCSTHKA